MYISYHPSRMPAMNKNTALESGHFCSFYILFPSNSVGWMAERSTSSRQRTLIITVGLPSRSVPRPNDSAPQALQKRWAMVFLLNRYSVSISSPERSVNCAAGTNVRTKPFFSQCEQLQVIGCERSASTS